MSKNAGILLGLGALAYWAYTQQQDSQNIDNGLIPQEDNSLSTFSPVPQNFIPDNEIQSIDQNIVNYVDSEGGVMNSSDVQNANVRAFLWMIRCAEGTATMNDEGYRALFGWKPGNGKVFTSFATHPGVYNSQYNTSAAGAYQITYTTWSSLCDKYPSVFPLRDFTPATQDLMAVTLIDGHRALDMVKNGQFDAAVRQINKGWTEWASLPSSTAGQPTRSWDFVRNAYLAAGGTIS